MGVKFSKEAVDAIQQRQPHLRVAAAERAAPAKVVPHPAAVVAPPAPVKKPRKKKPVVIASVPGQRWSFVFSGKAVSLNDFYSGMHWTKRNAWKDKWHNIFLDLMAEAQVQPVAAFQLELRYNSRMDTDNPVGTTKLLVDAMKGKYVPEDGKQYYRGLSIFPDETLPHNTYHFTIQELTP